MANDNPPGPPPNSGEQSICAFPKEVTLKYEHEPINKIAQAINEQTSAQQSANVDSTRIPEGQLQEQRNANHIARWSVWVNGALTLITAGVFACTAISLYLTRRDVADAAKQFEISNRPFINVSNLRLDSLEEGHHLTVRFDLYNTGKFPAQFVYIEYLVGFAGDSVKNDTLIKTFKSSLRKRIDSTNEILSSFPIVYPMFAVCPQAFANGEAKQIKTTPIWVVLGLNIKYIDFMTKKVYLKSEIHKLILYPNFRTVVIHSTEDSL